VEDRFVFLQSAEQSIPPSGAQFDLMPPSQRDGMLFQLIRAEQLGSQGRFVLRPTSASLNPNGENR
jgi:hypothetical protein